MSSSSESASSSDSSVGPSSSGSILRFMCCTFTTLIFPDLASMHLTLYVVWLFLSMTYALSHFGVNFLFFSFVA